MNLKDNLMIDEEFKNILPPLSEEEFYKLEESIMYEGCLESIKVWIDKTNNIAYIVDGHNRYNICTKHNINFQTYEMEFETHEDVLDWIINFQFSRRNINDMQKYYLRGLQYEREKKKQGGNQYTFKPKSIKTAERIAEQYQVSEKSIREDGKFANAIDKISKVVSKDIKNKILSREIIVSKQDIIKIATFETGKINELFDTKRNIIKLSDIKAKSTNTDSRKPIPQTTIKHLINRTSGKCEICNWGGIGLEGILIPHHKHKYSDTEDNSIENLSLICPNCHNTIHTLEKCQDEQMIEIIINNIDLEIRSGLLYYAKILNDKIK